MPEVKTKPLRALGTFVRGRGGTKVDERDHGVPCIRYGELYTHHDCVIRRFNSYIAPDAASSYTPLKHGDVVFAASGETLEEIGKAAAYCLPESAVASADTIIFRPGNQLDPTYVGYAVNADDAARFKAQRGQGSSVMHISADNLGQLKIRVPNIAVQQRIAEVLTSVDEAIEQTEALIAKMQKVKAGMLHDLFTRGVTADGELRAPREKSPELYEEKRVGWVPRDWGERRLDAVASIDRGRFSIRPRNDPRYYGGPFPFIQTGDVGAAQGRVLSTYSQTLNELGRGVSRLFPAGTIMVTIAANIADTCILGLPMCAPDSLVGVVVNQGEVARFLELCIRRKKSWFEARAPQTAQMNINLEDLRPLLIPYPDPHEQERIAARFEAFEARLVQEEWTAAKLREQKKGLLADLLSGRVAVNLPEASP